MQSLRQIPVQLFRRLAARYRAWKARHQPAAPIAIPFLAAIPSYNASIARDVTAAGVRFYSLCGDCGARLDASATLCDECAQKRSRPARPY